LGEKLAGKNLYGFLANETVSRTDSFGLIPGKTALFCYACRCEAVNLGPVGQVAYSYDKSSKVLNLGAKVERSFETEGLFPPLCKCKYRDSGHSSLTINGQKLDRDWRTFTTPYEEHDVACAADHDYPGWELGTASIPPGTELTIELTVDMTVTAICDGTEGSHVEKSLPVKYSKKMIIRKPQ